MKKYEETLKGKELAKYFLTLGLNPVPLDFDKTPLRKNHSNTRIESREIDKYDFTDIGVSTGSVSAGLEALDFDLKNVGNPEEVMQLFKGKVSKELLSRLLVQRTQSGGYHMVYRCEDVEGSRKLADNEEGKAFIETRGEGGYIKCAPSVGYKILQGNWESIPIITPEERLQLFVSARLLDRQLLKKAKKKMSNQDKYLTRFPEYNADENIGIELLTKHGWGVLDTTPEWIELRKPNSNSDNLHGGYNRVDKFLYVFSTTAPPFEPLTPYNNHAIYAELETEGNYRVAYAKLFDAGHGEGDMSESERKEIEEDSWQQTLNSLSFLSDETEEEEYLERARKDEIPLGLTTGWKALDEYYRLKENSFNMGIGYDGVGKSLFTLALAVSSNIIHDWKWGMVMPENKTAMSRRRLIELFSGRPIQKFRANPSALAMYRQKALDGFYIASNRKHYSITDVIEMGKKLYEYKGINALLIDPYNFFRVDSSNGYSWNNKILSELRVFADEYCSVYVMAHPSSEAPRKRKDAEGYLMPPTSYDIQGGADFPYRVDDFFITHRIKNHYDEEVRRTMQFIMTKVKEKETGGKEHSLGEHTELVWENKRNWLGYYDEYGNCPMVDYQHPERNNGGNTKEEELPF